MLYEGKIWLGTGEHPVCLLPQMANRHGLIAGATGTGKTVSLKVLAEGFSDMGVPVFLADIKGDLAGMVQPGTHSDNIANRLTQCGVPTFEYRTFPTVFWDVFGKEGHPVRTTVSEMGPTLLARRVPTYITQKLADDGIPFREVETMEEVMPELDVLYMTRVQKERFFNEADYIRLKDTYILDPDKLKTAKPDMAILHPLPRVNEISTKVDADPRAMYFEQVRNGRFVRMALISTLLEGLYED